MKFYFLRNQTFRTGIHRFGWNAAVKVLKDKFHDDSSDIALDDFVEFSFFAKPETTKDILPYTFKWIGFLHHPSNVTFPFDVKFGAPALFASEKFQKSLDNCKCLITLSETLARDARVLLERTPHKNKPIITLNYPTNLEVKKFNIDAFRKTPKVVMLGWWLRKMESLYKLKTSHPKFFMLGSSEWARGQHDLALKLYNEKRLSNIKWSEPDASVLPWLSGDMYDNFLSSCVVFQDLIDTSANSAVIECIASQTPVLVNYHSAVIEYLGRDYPLYYDSIEEASEKLANERIIIEAHEYMGQKEIRQRISYDTFALEFEKKIKEVII